MTKQTIGQFLATQRKAKGWTQQDVADMLGISNKTLSSWEQGRSYPDILMLQAIAEIFGVTVDEIVNGNRNAQNKEAGELSEKLQKRLLKNAANRYSIKCTVLMGIGIGGEILCALGLLLGFTAAAWLFILFAVIALITELIVALLFIVFEKSALAIEDEKSRYSLIIKRITYKAVFKIVCFLDALLILLCIIFFIPNGLQLLGLGLILICLLVVWIILSAIFLLCLARRGKEFYTEAEAVAARRNSKLAKKIFSIGAVGSVVLIGVFFILSTVSFESVYRKVDLPKEEFIRTMQTIGISKKEALDYGMDFNDNELDVINYFVDVKSALGRPDNKIGEEFYNIEKNLYLHIEINNDLSDGEIFISYIIDNEYKSYMLKQIAYGRIFFIDREEFMRKYPNHTANDLISAIENEEIFFVFDPELYSSYYDNAISVEYYIEVSDNNYALICKVKTYYPFLLIIGIFAALLSFAIAGIVFCNMRTKQNF